jgi:hypothetical protein
VGWSGQVQTIPSPPGYDPRTAQTVATRYTDYSILVYKTMFLGYIMLQLFFGYQYVVHVMFFLHDKYLILYISTF